MEKNKTAEKVTAAKDTTEKETAAKKGKSGKGATTSAKTLRYEEALGALEQVVRQLESGEGSLEDMIALYERGMGLVAQCNAQLDAYETKITKLAKLQEAKDEGD